MAKSSSNTVQSFAQVWGLPQDDISYIEKQFRRLHTLLRTSATKLDDGYEDLQIDSDGDRRHVDSFVYSQAVLLASYAGIDIDAEDMIEICKVAVQPFDQQRTVPAGYKGEMSLDDEDGLDNFELGFRRWKTLVLSHHRKHLIMGLLAEKEGKLKNSSSSFLDSQGMPEFGGISNYEYPSMADMSVAASIMEAPSVATFNSNDLFDDFDMSFTQSTGKNFNHNQSMYSKTSAGGLGVKSTQSFRSSSSVRSTTRKLPRIKSVPNLKSKSKANKTFRKLKRSASSQHNTIIEKPEDDLNPMERVAMLRRELESAKEDLAELDEKVDNNIAWVHSNCDTSVIGPISSIGKDKVRKIAVGKLFSVIDIRLKHSMYRALRQWENVIFTEKIRKTARDFSHIKSIEILTGVMNGAICRRLLEGWQPWMRKINVAKKWERNMAAVELQRVARGMLKRMSLKDDMIRKCIIKIQALLRRRLGVKRVKKIRMLKALAEKKAAKIRRENEAMRAKIEAQRKEEELKRRRGPARGHDHRSLRARHTDAAIKIQKLHRGNLGREKFFVHKQNFCALKIQKIVRGKLGRKRFKKIKSEQKTSWLGGFLGSSKPKDKKGGEGGMFSRLGFGGKKSQENSDNESVCSNDPPSVSYTKSSSSEVGSNEKILSEPIIEEVSKPLTPVNKSKAQDKEKIEKTDGRDGREDKKKSSDDKKKPASTSSTSSQKPGSAASTSAQKPGSASSTSSQKPGSASSTSSQKPGSASSTSAQKPGSASSTSSQKLGSTSASKDKNADSGRGSTPKSISPTAAAKATTKKDESPTAAAPKKLSKLQQMKADEEAKKKEKELNDAKEAAAEIEREAQRIKEEAIAEKAKIKEQAERDAAEMKVQAEEELAEARAELEGELEKEKIEWMKQLEELKKQNEDLQAAKTAADNAKAEIEAKAKADLATAKAEAELKAAEAAKAAEEAKLQSLSMVPKMIVSEEPSSGQSETTSHVAPAPESSSDFKKSQPTSKEFPTSASTSAATLVSNLPTKVEASKEAMPQQEESQLSSLGSSLTKSLGNFWKKNALTEEPVRPATTAGSSNKEKPRGETRPSSAFSSFFGGSGNKDKKKGKKKKQKFVPPTIDKFEANRRIVRASTMKAAYNEIKRRREAAQAAQALTGKLILWAVVIIQARIARGPIGRKRFMQLQDDLIKAREVRRDKAATKIQAMVRAVPDRVRVKEIRAEKDREAKLASMLKFKKDQDEANAYKVQGSGLTPEQEAALQAKLDRLAEMEKSIIEKELKMAQATRLADERAAAMEKAMKDFEERARIEEAERAMQRQMMELAAGPVQTARSEALVDPKSTRTPRTKRDNFDPPPTARSAREEGIPKDAEKFSFEGRKWYKLWDEQESAYYWYCPSTKAAQWEKPGETNTGYESSGNTTDYSTDWYESGGDYTDGEGETWQEYYDDAAQAKYWYNPATGEASWVQPASSTNSSPNRSRKNSAKLTAKEIPAAAYEAPDDWISYLDAETQQEYWYNTKTGETSWDR